MKVGFAPLLCDFYEEKWYINIDMTSLVAEIYNKPCGNLIQIHNFN